MDYRELLIAYIQHVKECEGIDFILLGGDNYSGAKIPTPEQWAELERLAEIAAEKSVDESAALN